MPKRKKMKNYGNIIRPNYKEKYINQWTNNQETKEDLKMISLLLMAEGGSVVQILICEDEIYNGVFHLKRFKFREDDFMVLEVDDLDDIHDPKKQTFKEFMDQLPELIEKYDIVIPEDLDLSTHPLHKIKELELLVME
jgi:hypothetical protein